MYCPKCGNYIANGIKKCPHCDWNVGDEVIKEEEKEEVKEIKKLSSFAKVRFTFEIITFLLLIGSFVVFFIFSYSTDKKSDNLLSNFIYLNDDKANIFILFSKSKKWFSGAIYSKLMPFIVFKLIFFVLSCVLLLFYLYKLLLLIKKIKNKDEDFKSNISLAYLIIILLYLSSVSSENIHFIIYISLIFILTIILSIDAIFNCRKNEFEKNIKPLYIVTIWLSFIAIILLNYKNIIYGDNDYTFIDYAYQSAIINGSTSENSVGIIASIFSLLSILFISLMPKILSGMKNNGKFNSLLFFIPAVVIFLAIFTIFSVIQIKNADGLEKININFIFIGAIIVSIVASVSGIITMKKNVDNYKKTKIYNL